MGIFKGQLANVVEWEEYNEDILFWKWQNREIKKGSRLIIRQGQDAIFLYNGRVEGIFEDEGSFDIESEIIPFLSTLKGFKFGFNSGIRAEVLFINTKEITVRWGTKNPINIPAQGLPGGMPIRSFGTFNCKISDFTTLIDKIAGIRQVFTIDDVKERVISMLDQMLMKWIVREGKDIFNLQANAFDISDGITKDLDEQMQKIGIGITGFAISSFSYPEEIQAMANKAASQSMVGDVNRYTQMAMADSMAQGNGGGGLAGDMVKMQMGMAMGQQMINQMNQGNQTNQGMQGQYQPNVPNPGTPQGFGQGPQSSGGYPPQGAAVPGYGAAATPPPPAAPSQSETPTDGPYPKFCPECGAKTTGGKFCANCGSKLM